MKINKQYVLTVNANELSVMYLALRHVFYDNTYKETDPGDKDLLAKMIEAINSIPKD